MRPVFRCYDPSAPRFRDVPVDVSPIKTPEVLLRKGFTMVETLDASRIFTVRTAELVNLNKLA